MATTGEIFLADATDAGGLIPILTPEEARGAPDTGVATMVSVTPDTALLGGTFDTPDPIPDDATITGYRFKVYTNKTLGTVTLSWVIDGVIIFDLVNIPAGATTMTAGGATSFVALAAGPTLDIAGINAGASLAGNEVIFEFAATSELGVDAVSMEVFFTEASSISRKRRFWRRMRFR